MKIFALVMILITAVHAKVWIVDNNPFPVGDFTTFSDAHNAASDGDTIYVYGSNTTYAAITTTKRLVYFGTGFDLTLHEGQAFAAASTISGTMNFNAGSEGSLIAGFDGTFAIVINANNITVKRNELAYVTINNSNCQLLQNEIVYSRLGTLVSVASNLGNIIILNNKINNTQTDYSYAHAINCNTTSTVSCTNNVIRTSSNYTYTIANLSATSIAQNNILYGNSTNRISGDGVFQYNMCHNNQLPEGNGNIRNVNMNTVFENPGDFNTGLHLLPDSPAIGTGYGGTDMGIYGGDAPYVDGGFPGIPSVYHLESEVITTPEKGLDVLIRAKSNKE